MTQIRSIPDDVPRCLACDEPEDAHPVSRTSVSDNMDEVLVCSAFQRPDVEEELEKGPPDLPPPVSRRSSYYRARARQRRLQAAADAGYDTWDEYRGEK